MEINKEIIGKAYLEYASSHDRFMLSETYIPLICQCVKKRGLESVDASIIKHALDEEYGLSNITIGAVEAFLKRMTKLNYFKKKDNAYFSLPKISECKDDSFKQDFLAKYEALLGDVRQYIKTHSGIDCTEEKIDDYICNFLNKYDLDLFYRDLSNIERLATQDKDEKRFTYLFSKYVIDIFQNSPQQAEFLRKLSKGHILSSIVSFENLNDYFGKLNKVTIYIDAPLIYGLLGFSNPVNKELIEEVLKILQNGGASLAIFRHNYNEVIGTLDDAKDRLTTGDFDLRVSSRVLRFAVREHKSSLFIQEKLIQVDELLKKWRISILDKPDLPLHYTDIDEKKLTSIVEKFYKSAKHKFLLKYQETLIDTDVDSISSIYRLRGNQIAHNLKSCIALLVTTNVPICKASNNKTISEIHHIIPVAITDVDLSALLWTNNPQQNENLDTRMLMAECLDNIRLDDTLLYKFKEEAKKRMTDGSLSKETYALLMTSHLSDKLLADKTYNDSDAYTDSTLDEIAEIFLAKKDQQIIDLENYNNILKEKIEENKNLEFERENKINDRVRFISDKIASCLMAILFVLVLTSSIYKEIVSSYSDVVGHILSVISFIWLVYSILIRTVYPNMPSIKSLVSRYIEKAIYGVLRSLNVR